MKLKIVILLFAGPPYWGLQVVRGNPEVYYRNLGPLTIVWWREGK